MDISQLVYFKAIIEEGNLSAAAVKMHISQPALSASIHKLETELGFLLFHRVGKKLVLSDAGKAYLECVESALSTLKAGKERALEISNGANHLITLCLLTAIPVSQLIVPFANHNPGYCFDVKHLSYSDQAVKALEDQSVDFCFTCTPIVRDTLKCRYLLTQKLYLVVSEKSKYAEKPHIKLSSLKNENFIEPLYPPYQEILERGYEEAGIRPQIVCRSESFQVIHGLISTGAGQALLPPSFQENRYLVYIPISDILCTHDVFVSWNPSSRQASNKIFLDFVLQQFRGRPWGGEFC